jgi:hypothetical protein
MAATSLRPSRGTAMVKAIARAFRWREMIESGTCATIREIATAENINETYVGRTLRLTLLAPDVVQGILAGRQSATVAMSQLMEGFPLEWKAQCAFLSEPQRPDDERLACTSRRPFGMKLRRLA